MDASDKALASMKELIAGAAELEPSHERTEALVVAGFRGLNILHEEILKLRKELRARKEASDEA